MLQQEKGGVLKTARLGHTGRANPSQTKKRICLARQTTGLARVETEGGWGRSTGLAGVKSNYVNCLTQWHTGFNGIRQHCWLTIGLLADGTTRSRTTKTGKQQTTDTKSKQSSG